MLSKMSLKEQKLPRQMTTVTESTTNYEHMLCEFFYAIYFSMRGTAIINLSHRTVELVTTIYSIFHNIVFIKSIVRWSCSELSHDLKKVRMQEIWSEFYPVSKQHK